MGWVASLSNGETVQEGPWVEGRLSPWQAFRQWLTEHPDTKVTQLRLQMNGPTIVCLPHAEGYFQARYASGHPLQGDDFHDVGFGVGTVIGDWIFINWMNSEGNVWQEIRPLEENRVHTTLA